MRAASPHSEGWGIVLKNRHTDHKAPSFWGRFVRWKQSIGIQSRIFCYFLLFTALLLLILWLFQVVFLDDFYRMQKTNLLRSTSESIVRNIDNDSLNTLVSRIAEENSTCVLIVDEKQRPIMSAEAWTGCIIHHMSPFDRMRMAHSAEETGEVIVADFPLIGFRNRQYDERKFQGAVPPSDDGSARSMITVQSARLASGQTVFVYLNTMITPVSATKQTILHQLVFITAILVLLSFLLSLVLSRHITRPLIQTTAAAADLSHGEYKPVTNVGYREIEQLNRQLKQAAVDLHRVEQMQQELIANISHDLRTPLTLIEGYAEVVRDLPDEATPENMQVIIDETKRLSTLVNSILELNAARNAAQPLEIKPFNVTESISSILTRYQKLTEQDGYCIVFEPAEQVIVLADEMRVQQVIYNLINNALTYTGEDQTVIVRQRIESGHVRIEIADTGEGIAPEELSAIWDRYYRGAKPHKRAAIGSGLGLSIVKGILEKHGLAYGVESVQGKGSTFWFALNLSE